MDDWRYVERRRNSGWTMFKEIVGTIIGALPFAIMAFGWGVHVESNIATNTANIRQLQEQRAALYAKLDQIDSRTAQIAVDLARLTGVLQEKDRHK
jgi:hypothetical protein